MWHEGAREAVILFGPAASSLPHALLLKGKPRCASACGRCAPLLKTAQHPLRAPEVICFSLGWIQESLRRKQATLKMSSCGWSLCSEKWSKVWIHLFTGSALSVEKWSQAWHEDMDSARRVWLFFLLKPEEFTPGNHAVNVRVSGVSLYIIYCFIRGFSLFLLTRWRAQWAHNVIYINYTQTWTNIIYPLIKPICTVLLTVICFLIVSHESIQQLYKTLKHCRIT